MLSSSIKSVSALSDRKGKQMADFGALPLRRPCSCVNGSACNASTLPEARGDHIADSCLQQDPELVRVSFLPPWLPGVLMERDFTHTCMIALRSRSPRSVCSQQRGCGRGERMEGQPPTPRQPCHAPQVARLSGGVCPCRRLQSVPCLEEGLDPVPSPPVSSAVSDGGCLCLCT